MKAISLIFCFGFMLSLTAQEATKYPLLEHFTNTKCPVCASRNPGFHDLRQSFGDQINHVAFHPKYPYSTCEFYQANKEGNQSRTEHYNISGTPTVFLDGTEGQGTNLVRESAIESALMQNSFFELTVTEERMNDIVTVTVEVIARGDVPAGNSYRLYVVTLEEIVNYAAPNGENKHYNVFREFSSSKEGAPIPALNDGETESFTFQYTLNENWVTDEMYSLAFLENDQDGSIENSGRSSGIISSSENYEVPAVIAYPVPTEDMLHFSEPIQQIQVFDMHGKLRVDEKFTTGSNVVSFKDLFPGIYIMRYKAEDQYYTRKIIID